MLCLVIMMNERVRENIVKMESGNLVLIIYDCRKKSKKNKSNHVKLFSHHFVEI